MKIDALGIHATKEDLAELELLRAELAHCNERIAELEAMINTDSFDKYLVIKLKDLQLAEEFARVRIADKALHEIVENQTNIIARLKEDGERLADIVQPGALDIMATNDEGCFVQCNRCQAIEFHEANKAYYIPAFGHAPNCPIALHNALMKELEEKIDNG